MSEFPPEAPWVTAMRDHFHLHGFYRREDLERLLGKPGDRVSVSVNGEVVYHAASRIDARRGETGTGSISEADESLTAASGDAQPPVHKKEDK